VDVPSVAGCILLRPTASVSLHLQMIGRCLRPQPGKQAVILDHVGNVLRLGHHLEEREWSLAGVPKQDREKAPSVKACPQCFAAMPSAKTVCPDCGHQFTPERRELEHVDGELVEVQRREELPPIGPYMVGDVVNGSQTISEVHEDGWLTVQGLGGEWRAHKDVVWFTSRPDPRREAKREQGRATTVEELIAIGKRRGMKNPRGWARHVMAARETKGHWRRVA